MSSILKPAENPEISEAFEKMPMWWEFLEYRKASKLKAHQPRYLLSLFGGIVFSLYSETSKMLRLCGEYAIGCNVPDLYNTLIHSCGLRKRQFPTGFIQFVIIYDSIIHVTVVTKVPNTKQYWVFIINFDNPALIHYLF